MYSQEQFVYPSHQKEKLDERIDSISLYDEVCGKFAKEYPEHVRAVTILFGQDVQRMAHVGDEEKEENTAYGNCLNELYERGVIGEKYASELEKMIARESGADHGTFHQVHEDKIILRMRNMMVERLVSKYREALGELSPEWKKHQRVH